MSFVVAIDGPAGSGKGTIAKLIGKKLNLTYIDTGAMFRCIALQMKRNNITIDEENRIQNILDNSKIELKTENDEVKVYLNGEDVSEKIRTEEISNFVSPISTVQIIRDKLLEMQRKMAESSNIIMEGRDIGTVVFPNADVKIFLSATAEERARRRVKQYLDKGIKAEYETVLEDIKIRDQRDSTRAVAPLKKAEDAILVDSTNMTISEVVDSIVNIINEKIV
jgi:cytidylate kinase